MTQNTKTSKIEELGRVWTPEANWQIPIDSGEAVFVFPAFGPNNYDAVVKQVLASRQRLPTGEQSAFMLDETYNSADEGVKKSPRTEFVRKTIMNDGWLWVPQVNIWTPRDVKNPGMYSLFDENGEGLGKERDISELEDRLSGGSTERGVRFSQDRKVAFAPLNTITSGNHEKGKLSQDGAFIAVYRVKGAEKLDEVAKAFGRKPYSWTVDNNSNKPIQSLSALGGCGGLGAYRLYAYFYSGGADGSGYVLSVSGSNRT